MRPPRWWIQDQALVSRRDPNQCNRELLGGGKRVIPGSAAMTLNATQSTTEGPALPEAAGVARERHTVVELGGQPREFTFERALDEGGE